MKHQILTEPILYLALSASFLLLAKRKEGASSKPLLIFLLYFIIDVVLTTLPFYSKTLNFLSFTMNWEGKLFSYLGAIIVILAIDKPLVKKIGLSFRIDDEAKKFAFINILVISTLVVIYGVLIGGYDFSVENALFQLTMPSIVEEIVYRGILLMLLNEVFIRSFRIGKIKFGMGLIVTSILFGLLHALSILDDFSLSINWIAFLITFILGAYLALVRERTGSLIVPIILHIIINFVPVIIGGFMQ